MEKLRAIANLTIKEAVRKKIVLLFAIFAVAMISSSAFLPVLDKDSQVKLVEQWALRAITLFSAISVIFLAGASLPSDIEEKRIHTLLSKPVGKPAILAGKFAGFIVVIAVGIALMGVVGWGYIRVVHAIGGHASPLGAAPRFVSPEIVPDGDVVSDEDELGKRFIIPREGNGRLAWIFRGLDRSQFSEEAECAGCLMVSRENDKFFGAVIVEIVNPQTLRKSSKEYSSKYNSVFKVSFPRELISDQGGLIVTVSKTDPHSAVVACPEAFVLNGADRSFEFNFLKGLGLIFAQTAIIMAATLMATAFLSAPVSIFFGIFVYFCGSMYGFAGENLKSSEAYVRAEEQREKTKDRRMISPKTEIDPWLIKAANEVSRNVLRIIPDFGKFDFAPFLLNNRAVDGKTLLDAMVSASLYAIVFLAVGFAAFRGKDFS